MPFSCCHRFLLLASLAAALPAAAIVIRADRDDAEYLELASRYESAVAFDPLPCGGVLIAARWVLTSASAAAALDRKPHPRLQIGRDEHEVEAVFISAPRPLGLVLLKSAVKDVEPNVLYRERDEAGKGVVIVSHGPTGKIGEAATRADRKARAAINTVDGVTDSQLELKIKAPDDASDLQGAAVAGDCGSPAYIDAKEGIFVAGIATAGKSAPQIGDSNFYFRVSPQVEWIEAVMLGVAKREMDTLLR